MLLCFVHFCWQVHDADWDERKIKTMLKYMLCATIRCHTCSNAPGSSWPPDPPEASLDVLGKRTAAYAPSTLSTLPTGAVLMSSTNTTSRRSHSSSSPRPARCSISLIGVGCFLRSANGNSYRIYHIASNIARGFNQFHSIRLPGFKSNEV